MEVSFEIFANVACIFSYFPAFGQYSQSIELTRQIGYFSQNIGQYTLSYRIRSNYIWHRELP